MKHTEFEFRFIKPGAMFRAWATERKVAWRIADTWYREVPAVPGNVFECWRRGKCLMRIEAGNGVFHYSYPSPGLYSARV